MAQKIKEVLEKALAEAKPSDKEIHDIESKIRDFLERLRKELKALKIHAEVFVGGSFAKKTLIKKEKYDVDVFMRFDKKYAKQDISELTGKVLRNARLEHKINIIHGSRDYFRIDIKPELCFEIVPVIKVSGPKEAENITDLSYYHVKYINEKIGKKLVNDIILAKSFCHANRVYGAESHIKGFSGYSLELLISYYKSFAGFIREMAKSGKERIIIDIEKHYKNRNQVLMDMNSSKLESPIILVDPTYKQRNALATLSPEVFEKFRAKCREFLRKPDINFFRLKEINFSDIENSARKKGYDFLLLRISTNKQEGAIAGSKLLKFYNHLNDSIKKYFDIRDKGFYYNNKGYADCFFAVKKKDRLLVKGPPVKMDKEAKKFRSMHKKIVVKSGIIYAEEKIDFSIKEFISQWEKKNNQIIRDMYISGIKILN